MNLNVTAEKCVLVAKNKKFGKDKKVYCTVGISQVLEDGNSVTGEFNVSEEVFSRIDSSLMYKPVFVDLQYGTSKDYGSFLRVINIIPVSSGK